MTKEETKRFYKIVEPQISILYYDHHYSIRTIYYILFLLLFIIFRVICRKDKIKVEMVEEF
jgi:hypothetical protein